jgi:hypothetical protein
MRNVIALALLLVLGATAQAKYAPVEAQLARISPDDLAISSGPGSATLEQNYFRAPQSPSAAQRLFPFPCRLHVFAKTRLAQSCN